MSAPVVGIPCPMCHRVAPADATECPHDGARLLEETFVGDRLLGARLGAYQVLERIGSGGMGLVYRAVQPEIGKQVAIKVLRPERIEADGGVDRLLAEARAVNVVEHPGIVDIFGFGEAPDGRPYIVMELLHGEPLDRLISPERPLPPPEAIALIDGIAAPLGAAHAAGVTHGDLKPNNVFVLPGEDGSRAVKLLDFGLARRWAPGNAEQGANGSVFAGTPRYLAPELVGGAPSSPASDLYALGVIAYELLTGSNPFRADDAAESIRRHLEMVPPAPSTLVPGVPKAVDALVLELLAKNPSARPSSAEAVRKRLSAEISAQPPSRAPRSKPPPSKPPVERPPVPVSALPRDTVETDSLAKGGWPRPAALALVVLLAIAAGASIFYLTLHALGRATPSDVERPVAAPSVPARTSIAERTPTSEPARHPKRARRPAWDRGPPSWSKIEARVQRLKQAFAARPDWWRSGHPRAIRRLQRILANTERDDSPEGRRWAAARLDAWQRHFLPR